MDSNWAAENLRTIRTLMERSTLYRRALAPVMFTAGSFGTLGAVTGEVLGVSGPVPFLMFWMAVAGLTLATVLFLVRRQAGAAGEPVWSPPARRVANALTPPFLCGLILGAGACFKLGDATAVEVTEAERHLHWITLAWVILYGCALHSAGQFISRGMQRFALALVIFATAVLVAEQPNSGLVLANHRVMGGVFGISHLACGIYLLMTEKKPVVT